jgi:hypothetical protein
MRMWAKAFPDQPPFLDVGERLNHYEALASTVIDEHEAAMRRKLSQPWRTLAAAAEQTELPL